jgi:hypothetical protein
MRCILWISTSQESPRDDAAALCGIPRECLGAPLLADVVKLIRQAGSACLLPPCVFSGIKRDDAAALGCEKEAAVAAKEAKRAPLPITRAL